MLTRTLYAAVADARYNERVEYIIMTFFTRYLSGGIDDSKILALAVEYNRTTLVQKLVNDTDVTLYARENAIRRDAARRGNAAIIAALGEPDESLTERFKRQRFE